MSEYQSQHDARLEKHPASIIVVLLLVLAGCVLTAQLINRTITTSIWQPDLGPYSERLTALSEYGESVTTVFVGSSHILDAAHPETFNQVNEQLGQPEFAYNAAQYGAVMPIQRNTLELLDELNLNDLRYVFFEPMLMAIPISFDDGFNNAFSTRNRYFYDTPTSLLAAQMRWSSDRSFMKRAIGVGGIGFVWAVHKSNLGVLRDVIAPVERDRTPIELAWDELGYTGGRRAPDPNIDFSNKPEMEKGYRKISETELQVLDQFVDTIRRAGAEPVFLFPPTRANLGKQRAIRDAAKERYRDIMVMDYSYDTNPLEMYFDESLWLDKGHMRESGARIFTTRLVNDWRQKQQDRDNN